MGRLTFVHVFLLHLRHDFVYGQANGTGAGERVATILLFCQNSHVTVPKNAEKENSGCYNVPLK